MTATDDDNRASAGGRDVVDQLRSAGALHVQPEALSQQRHHRRAPGSASPESPHRLRIALW